MITWPDFYKQRVNNPEYESYFKKRYEPFLNVIKNLNPDLVFEDGVGIGSVMKALPLEMNCAGCDLNRTMLELASINNNERKPYLVQYDILEDRSFNFYINEESESWNNDHIIVSHGVLEHFSDAQILKILESQKTHHPDAIIHYVPTNKYKKPSFGDERLLSVQHWVDLTMPIAYDTFNNGYDLMMIYK